jgi:hypothetical protein
MRREYFDLTEWNAEVVAMSDLPTGLALREAVATEVMGLPSRQATDGGDCWRDVPYYETEVPYYETDIAAAWQVVERMRGKGFWLHLHHAKAKLGFIAFFLPEGGSSRTHHGDSAAVAICRAALAAVRAFETTAPSSARVP